MYARCLWHCKQHKLQSHRRKMKRSTKTSWMKEKCKHEQCGEQNRNWRKKCSSKRIYKIVWGVLIKIQISNYISICKAFLFGCFFFSFSLSMRYDDFPYARLDNSANRMTQHSCEWVKESERSTASRAVWHKYKSISRPTIYRLYRRVIHTIDIWFWFTSLIWYLLPLSPGRLLSLYFTLWLYRCRTT